MAVNLHHRDFANLTDFSPTEIRFLLQLARDLKAAKYGRYESPSWSAKTSP
jgi:ornithine carbamoyltransferase